jgi:hypothetical protein
MAAKTRPLIFEVALVIQNIFRRGDSTLLLIYMLSYMMKKECPGGRIGLWLVDLAIVEVVLLTLVRA